MSIKTTRVFISGGVIKKFRSPNFGSIRSTKIPPHTPIDYSSKSRPICCSHTPFFVDWVAAERRWFPGRPASVPCRALSSSHQSAPSSRRVQELPVGRQSPRKGKAEMAGMAVNASTGVMSSLLSKLSVLLSDQYKQLKGVRRDIEFLSRELTDMNAALEDLADMEKLDAQTKAWRDKVREMAYDIEDVIDVFMHHHAQQVGDGKGGFLSKATGLGRTIRKLRVR
ncbi:hypothetical protein BS78_09G020000 [Paspalum vaginatum]|nr:hypothetical protein BS78_09G020000 [Paspalum vaginatum]